MARVWEVSQQAGTHLLMLLAIADFADDQGNAYPSVATLAEKCRMKERNAQAILSALKASGELDVRPNEGPRGTNLYRVALVDSGMQKTAPPQQSAPMQDSAGGGAKDCAKGVQWTAPKPSLNHQEPSVARKHVRKARSTFKEWYESWEPKRFADDDSVHELIKRAGLNEDFLMLYWRWFKDQHLDSDKKQADWLRTFRTYLRNGWGGLWYRDRDRCWLLTTVGKQVALRHDLDEDMFARADLGLRP